MWLTVDYSLVRHPSYCGFFYWAIATQLLMSNVVSTVLFVVILGRFFSSRIKGELSINVGVHCLTLYTEEEVHLVRFFGQKYIDYRKKVGSGLPWVR